MNKQPFLEARWVRSLYCQEEMTIEPYLHIFKEFIFPESCFKNIQRHFITLDFLKENTREKKENRFNGRHNYFLCPELLEQLKCTETKSFWNKFLINFKSSISETKCYLLNEFQKTGLAIDCCTENLSVGFRFVTESLPFDLAPHMDMPQKIAVCVIYINNSGEIENGGTHLYKKTSNDCFKEEICYDFIENSFVLIPRVLDSWHGGSWKGQGTRKSFHVYFFNHPSSEIKYLRNKFSFLM